jgi:hypothetical protein
MTGVARRSAYQTRRSTPVKPEASRTGGNAGWPGWDRENEGLNAEAAQQGVGKPKYNAPHSLARMGGVNAGHLGTGSA